MWLYTTIVHPVRMHFDLTERDYCIIDTIAQLSANPKASTAGWCNASNGTIAKWLGTTPKNIISVVKKAIEKGLIEVQDTPIGSTQLRRATSIWYDAISTKKLPKTKGNTLTPKVTPPITNGNTPYNQRLQQPITNGNTDIYIDKYIDNKESVVVAKATPTQPKFINEFKEAILYLNSKTGRAFQISANDEKGKTDKYKLFAKLMTTYSLEDAKAVIDNRCAE